MSAPRSFVSRRRAAGAALIVLAVASQGCGDAGRQATIYRVQRGYWKAFHAGQELNMKETAPDTTDMLRVRSLFVDAIGEASKDLDAMKGRPRTALDTKLLRVVGYGEIQAATVAMDARRPDLVIDRCRDFVSLAEGDTTATREADIMIAGALRRMHRYDESLDHMRAMLAHYAPRPDTNNVEDFILSVPTLMISIRQEQGDAAGVRAENEAAARYYDGLAGNPSVDPRVQTSALLHLVHSRLELGQKSEALQTLDRAEQLVSSHKELASSIPEIRYTRVKLTGLEAKDPMEPATTLERIAFDFPQSNVAPMALFDAASLMERAGALDRAKAGYAAVISRYPRSGETAAQALLRQGAIEARSGDWERAKAILESVWANYPRSTAAAQAPFIAVKHYADRRDVPGARVALQRGVEVYRGLVSMDSLAAGVPLLRWNMLQMQANLGDTQGVFGTADALYATAPESPYAAQGLIAAANYAESKGLRAQAATYLNQFLVAYPKSPLFQPVQDRLRKLTK